MQRHEYTVIPAPARGEKARGARTGAERFSFALLTEMNRMAAQGWEYVRAETLPCEERSGLTSRTTVYHNVLVFRREIAAPARAIEPVVAAAPGAAQPPAAARPAPSVRSAAPAASTAAAPTAAPVISSEPPSDWPDGAEDDDSAAAQEQGAWVDNYDEPGFDPEPTDAPPAGDEPANPPAFVQRPPLAAARPAEPDRPAFGQPLSGAHRLGPAER